MHCYWKDYIFYIGNKYYIDRGYFFQNEGINSISTAKNSSLPIIIAIDKVHFAAIGNWLKFPEGPISVLNPGPTTAIAVAAADNEDSISIPKKHNIAATISVEKINKKINVNIERMVLSSRVDWAYDIFNTWCGLIIFFICWVITENNICKRNIFIPPVVDPVQPPINIKINNNAIAKLPHSEKSEVE